MIVTLGTFDKVHDGHLELFRYGADLAKQMGGKFTILVNRSEFVREYKGVEVESDLDRMYLVTDAVYSKLGNPEHVKVGRNNQVKPGDRADLRGASFVLIGSDWHDSGYLDQIGWNWDDLHARMTSVIYVPRRSGGPSSTKIREER